MIIGTGQQTIIDLRDTAETRLEHAYMQGKTVQDEAGSIILQTGRMELIKEPSGLIWLSGKLIETANEGTEIEQRWDFEFLPSNGVNVVRDHQEVTDISACALAARRLLELITQAEQGQAA